MNIRLSLIRLYSMECGTKKKGERLSASKPVAVIITVLFAAIVTFVPAQSAATGHDSSVGKHVAQDSENQPQPHIVFLINKEPHNYEADKTIPPFADMLSREHRFKTTVIEAEGEVPALRFPDLGAALSQADLLVVFFRRAALPVQQLNAIKKYLKNGMPLVGIRTANHAFTVRSQDGEIPDGYRDWPEFVPEILGQKNLGYGSVEDGTAVAVAPGAAGHSIVEGFKPVQWQSTGNLYLIKLLDDKAKVLLTGMAGENVNPVAYTRKAGKSRIFYTSLGYPDDFKEPRYRNLLVNAIRWTLN